MKTTKIITGLLALLGFAGCEPGGGKDMYGPPVVMYGIINVGFRVKGSVTDEAGNPLDNIRIVLKVEDEDQPALESFRDTVYTEDGKFVTDGHPTISRTMSLIASDIDGEENGGEFVPAERSFYAGASAAWEYEDGAQFKEIDFILKPKTEENDGE